MSKKPTIAALQESVAAAEKRADENFENGRQWKKLADDREKEIKDVKLKFDDLKTRLHAAEAANQHMRGYLARVQEDDAVREELIQTGEPGGEQLLIPKRKPTQFARPDDFTQPHDNGIYCSRYMDSDRPKPKHWITY